MDADTILRIKPALTTFLHAFDGCFGRSQTRGHLATYVRGQLSNLPRKSVEPMADAAGIPPRTLQEFLSLSRWDEPMLRDRLQQRVARRHGHPQSVGVIDEGSYVKKGDKTACVQRQHCGAAGKKENCVVSVHLGYATPAPGSAPGSGSDASQGFHTLLDGELYLPEHTWHADRQRCREAGIPDEVVFRTKHQIALEQYRRAVANGVRFRWLTFDEFYGRNKAFLREFDAGGQDYVAEVPVDFHVWTRPPQVLHRRHSRDLNKPGASGGRSRKYPRLKVKHNPTSAVRDVLLHSPRMRKQPWVRYRVKDGSKGPMVWEVKHLTVYLNDDQGLPAFNGRAYHLLVARSALNPDEIKYFVSNAAPDTPVQTLLLVAFSRWTIERMFEDSKMELGLDHFEARKYQAISRHLLISCVSHLFLAEFHKTHRGEKSGPDDQPGGDGSVEAGAAVVAWGPLFAGTGRGAQRATGDNARPQRQGRPQPPQADDPQIAHDRHQVEGPLPLPVGRLIAL